MSKILEFEPIEESVAVPRILIEVHQAIDAAFPDSTPAPSRFAKTAIFGNDEPTANKPLPTLENRNMGTTKSVEPPPPVFPTTSKINSRGPAKLPSAVPSDTFEDSESSYKETAPTKWSFFIIPLSIIIFFVILAVALIWSQH